ncbi:MAG: hypothetical protein KAS17_03025, partial [Victivallaceae bacterium]|nr:hypothetical protein [Victivallaceae bacterium]
MKKGIISITIAVIFICLPAAAEKYTLFKPKYAKLILSKDKKKILTIAFDTCGKDNTDYKVMYISQKLDGSFTDIKRIPGNASYRYHIFNNAKFPPFKLPPLYDKNAEHETKIWVEHWHNQKKIWERGEDQRRFRAKRGRYV